MEVEISHQAGRGSGGGGGLWEKSLLIFGEVDVDPSFAPDPRESAAPRFGSIGTKKAWFNVHSQRHLSHHDMLGPVKAACR